MHTRTQSLTGSLERSMRPTRQEFRAKSMHLENHVAENL